MKKSIITSLSIIVFFASCYLEGAGASGGDEADVAVHVPKRARGGQEALRSLFIGNNTDKNVCCGSMVVERGETKILETSEDRIRFDPDGSVMVDLSEGFNAIEFF